MSDNAFADFLAAPTQSASSSVLGAPPETPAAPVLLTSGMSTLARFGVAYLGAIAGSVVGYGVAAGKKETGLKQMKTVSTGGVIGLLAGAVGSFWLPSPSK